MSLFLQKSVRPDLQDHFDFGDRLFDQLFGVEERSHSSSAGRQQFGLVETDDAFILSSDLPGVSKEDCQIEIQDGVLSVRAKRSTPKVDGKVHLPYSEAGQETSFALNLPKKVDQESFQAALENGVLTITMKKHELSRRTIEIS